MFNSTLELAFQLTIVLPFVGELTYGKNRLSVPLLHPVFWKIQPRRKTFGTRWTSP